MRLKSALRKMTLSAMFLALGLVLPFLTGQIPQIGSMLLPMHVPVFLCGLICGFPYGALIGFVMPLLRSALFSVPVFFPTATAMAFELMAYGFFSGLFYGLWRKQGLLAVYLSLISSMLLGRGIWGLSSLSSFPRQGMFLLSRPSLPGLSSRRFPESFCSLSSSRRSFLPSTRRVSSVSEGRRRNEGGRRVAG